MDNKITYHEQNDIDNTLKLREVLKTLPPFCRDYFRAIDATTTTIFPVFTGAKSNVQRQNHVGFHS